MSLLVQNLLVLQVALEDGLAEGHIYSGQLLAHQRNQPLFDERHPLSQVLAEGINCLDQLVRQSLLEHLVQDRVDVLLEPFWSSLCQRIDARKSVFGKIYLLRFPLLLLRLVDSF